MIRTLSFADCGSVGRTEEEFNHEGHEEHEDEGLGSLVAYLGGNLRKYASDC